MGTDSPREQALAYGSRVGEAMAKQHIRDAQNILPTYVEQACVTEDTRNAMTLGMWGAYITYVASHITKAIGPNATYEILSALLPEVSRDTSQRH